MNRIITKLSSINLMCKKKDGGPISPVDAYFLVEIKGLFTIALLRFDKGRREAYHTHAFNALTWFLSGSLVEEGIDGSQYHYSRSLSPKKTPKEKWHRIKASRVSWCLTIRGPWTFFWKEYDPKTKLITTLTSGREVLDITK